MSNFHTFHSHVLPQIAINFADQASANSSYYAPFADGYRSNRAVFLLQTGTVATDVIDMALYQATTSGGTGRKAVTGASITQLTTADDNVLVTIDFGPSDLDDKNGFKWVRAEVTVGAAGTEPYTVLLIKYDLRHAGLSEAIHSSYEQQVVVGFS